MVELHCIADLFWAGGGLRTGAPSGTVFLPLLHDYLRLAGAASRNLLGKSQLSAMIQAAIKCD